MQMVGAEGRRLLSISARKPLSDCTNYSKPNPSLSSFSSFNESVTKCNCPTPTPSSTNASHTSSLPPPKIASLAGTVDRDVSHPISVASRRRRTSDTKNCDDASNTNVSTPTGAIDVDVSEPVSVFHVGKQTSNERKNKKKTVTNPVCSRPLPNISNFWDKSDGVEGLDLPKVPCRKKQRAVSNEEGVSKDAQLQDFIEKQKAYFKEIDEFKLSEEEVESIDELD